MSTDTPESTALEPPLESIRFVGPSTATVLRREGYDATAITKKRVSYRMLVRAGVNPGVAAKIRREHSLSWSFRSGGDLDRRSAQIRGLGSAEAAWVAASAGDWEATSEQSTEAATVDAGESAESTADTAGSDESTAWPTHDDTATDQPTDRLRAEAAWRARSKPTPVGELDGLDSETADLLATGGIISVRQLARVDVDQVVDALNVSERAVRTWQETARETVDH